MTTAMRVEVDGIEILPAQCTRSQGWKTAGERIRRAGEGKLSLTPALRNSREGAKDTDDVAGLSNSGSRGSGAGARDDGTRHLKEKRINKGKLLKGARMPDLPREDMKIIVRPRGGLRVSDVTRVELSRALTAAAQIPAIDSRKDVVCLNAQQNIVVVSTSKRENADRYAAVERIDVRGTTHEVSTYEAAPHGTVKGVIRDIPLEDTPQEIQENVVHEFNPTALQANRIGKTRSVVIAFAGKKVPRYIRYGNLLMECTLHRKQIDVCYACGRLGHRMDVCPDPSNTICRVVETPGRRPTTRATPSVACVEAITSRQTKPARQDLRPPTSSVDAGGRRSIPIKETTKEEEAETREFLQADPTVAARRGAQEDRRRRPGAATAAVTAAPGRNRGCGAAQVTVKAAPSLSPQGAAAAVVLAATGAGRRRAERRRRRRVVRDGEPAGMDLSPRPVRVQVAARDRGTDPETSEGTPATRSTPSTQKDGGEVTELKKIIECQNTHIQEQNGQIRAVMSKLEKLAGSSGSTEARPQEGPTFMANVAEGPRKVPRRGSPPAINPKTAIPVASSAKQKSAQEAMYDAEEAPVSKAAVATPKAEEQTQLPQGDALTAILAALGRIEDRLNTLEVKHERLATRVAAIKNSVLKERLQRLNHEAQEYAKKLATQIWLQVGEGLNGQLHVARVWQLFRTLLRQQIPKYTVEGVDLVVGGTPHDIREKIRNILYPPYSTASIDIVFTESDQEDKDEGINTDEAISLQN
ncbi:hypothetical protein HPB48_008587 [Haemaphysalis longicornis]|uniref:CCHC-type domain-containing protein n=1 Tax=Haemaphysalis longicornis TaxID=44386 RepID=A0A9J6GP57_HAELO|nr:hypothetical protein HPB48_008587 [Haemaphysalis longicornis]